MRPRFPYPPPWKRIAAVDEVSAQNYLGPTRWRAQSTGQESSSRKNYGSTPGSLDFVVMFVQGDQFLNLPSSGLKMTC